MTKEEAFSAAQFAYAAYDAFFDAVAQQVGREQAMAIQNQAMLALGAAQGQMIKAQAGIEVKDAATAYAVISNAIGIIGIETELVESSPGRVVFKPGRCPLCEAAQSLGWNDETREAGCRSGAIPFMDAAVKQLNPDLSYRLIGFGSGQGDSCLEEIVLAG